MRPPVVAGVGGAMGAGGGVLVAHFSSLTTRGCASVSISLEGKGHAFLPTCLEPGLALVGGLALLIGGSVLFLWASWVMARSWNQRERALPPRPKGPAPLEHTDLSPGFFSAAGTAALSPPPGWYAVPPDFAPMWWDGAKWGTAPTLPPVPSDAVTGR